MNPFKVCKVRSPLPCRLVAMEVKLCGASTFTISRYSRPLLCSGSTAHLHCEGQGCCYNANARATNGTVQQRTASTHSLLTSMARNIFTASPSVIGKLRSCSPSTHSFIETCPWRQMFTNQSETKSVAWLCCRAVGGSTLPSWSRSNRENRDRMSLNLEPV